MATITGISARTPRIMQGTMPISPKHAEGTEMHSMKCSFTDALERVETDATVAKNTAAAMKTQYRLSNFTAPYIGPDLYNAGSS